MDVDKLEKELVTMVEDDKLYWLRNDAKFRAAKDQVSYDEFEQRVKVSIINSFWNRITKKFKDYPKFSEKDLEVYFELHVTKDE